MEVASLTWWLHAAKTKLSGQHALPRFPLILRLLYDKTQAVVGQAWLVANHTLKYADFKEEASLLKLTS